MVVPVFFFWGVGGYIGIMENKMETTTMGYVGIIRYVLGIYWGDFREVPLDLAPAHTVHVLALIVTGDATQHNLAFVTV